MQVRCITGPKYVKFLDSSNDFLKDLGGHLAPPSLCIILIEIPQAKEGKWENDVSIAPIYLLIIR
jgi:hypothetical protein